jgi:triosephosphate isomerase
MRKKIAAGNWKMNTLPQEGNELVKNIITGCNNLKPGQQVYFFPPFTHLGGMLGLMNEPQYYVGAQNCSPFSKGAYTGEISLSMLKAVGAEAVIIGHSERRSIFGENFETLKEKTTAVINEGLTLFFCCGETLEERESGSHYQVIEDQIKGSLAHVSEADMQKVVIAYEPVWAIGTGKTASPEQAQDMHAHIRKLIGTYFNETVAQQTSILYGGSVNAANANALFSQPDIDGGLVGGASLKADEFIEIIQALP